MNTQYAFLQKARTNTLLAILNKAFCTASSPNNSKRSSPGNRSVPARSRVSSSGNFDHFLTAEFWREVFCVSIANPADTIGYCRFHVKGGFGVRLVAEDAWQTPRRIWWSAYFQSSR